MARGIVTKKPGTGTPNGRLIVTDPSVPSPGGGSDSDSGATFLSFPTEIGQTIEYNEANASQLGDVVDFNFDGLSATRLVTSIRGTVITGAHDDNVVVDKGQAIIIDGGRLEGKVSVNGGFLSVVGSSFLAGKVESATAGSFLIVDDRSTIEGKLEVSGASTVSVKNSTVEGKLSTTGTLYTTVTDSTIRGKLEVLNAKVCKCSGNAVEGTTNTPGCTA